MIKLLTDDKASEFIEFCRNDIAGAVIYTRYMTYGQSDDALFWYSEDKKGKINAVLSLFGSVLTVAPFALCDSDEVKSFSGVIGASEITKPGKYTLRFKDKCEHDVTNDITGENVKDIFDVVFEDDENRAEFFDGWYTDISHKIRHGLIHGKCIYIDGRCVSATVTSGETESLAVISSVATLKTYRKQGLASKTVTSLAMSLCKNKNVFLMTDDPKIKEFYINMGFELYEKHT